jgi:multiple sugar transport system permease protein
MTQRDLRGAADLLEQAINREGLPGAVEPLAGTEQAPGHRPHRSERRLAWLLCAPAVLMMLLVTVSDHYAFVLSVQDLDLRFPEEGGLSTSTVRLC